MRLSIYLILVFFINTSHSSRKALEISTEPVVVLNPSGINPLSATISLTTNEEALSYYTFDCPFLSSMGKSSFQKEHVLEILCLLPDKENRVTIHLEDRDKNKIIREITIKTEPLSSKYPDIEIHHIEKENLEPGLLFCDFHVGNNGKFESSPFILDNNGNIRWTLDLGSFGRIAWAPVKNKNGNIIFTNHHSVYEYDLMGNEISKWYLDDYTPTHDIIVLPNGNFIIPATRTANKVKALVHDSLIRTTHDFIIEYDIESESVINEWDLADILDAQRFNYNSRSDWAHINSVYFDDQDTTLIISMKNQGVCKVNWEGELQWILADHIEWGYSGRQEKKTDLRAYLLQLNSMSKDKSEQLRSKFIDLESGFGWPRGQHTATLFNEKSLLVFDNLKRQNDIRYSRVVEYAINQDAMTVDQIWEFDADKSTFARIVSSVQYQPEKQNMLINFGYCNFKDVNDKPIDSIYARVMEIKYPSNEILMDIQFLFKNEKGDGTLGWGLSDIMYRVKKFSF